ncbi:MAG: IMPACT family protein [Ignavibacteriaceae bacterium]
MNSITQIKTIASASETKLKEKSSVFLGFVFPVKSVEEAAEKLALLRKKYFDASHHCYAYRLTDGILKYSDDGEPNGTAGVRIFNAIEHFELVNVLLVVVRYFGGIKLGVGPLGKAYYNSAFQTIESAQIYVQKPYLKIAIVSNYLFINQIKKLLSKYEAKIEEIKFDEEVRLSYFVNPEKVEMLSFELTELSKGKTKISVGSSVVYL